ncbi:hypothetical protein BKA62DRAFT_416104 [Auriculariales sp. MPI-PUGE-AT-0066]|nr:hypothetical protein BKA62DRAFT_416104 [Auriculariales sp. MPI-PUGE-AT-0066]
MFHLPARMSVTAAANLRIRTSSPQPVAERAGKRKRQRSTSVDRQQLASMLGIIVPCTPPPTVPVQHETCEHGAASAPRMVGGYAASTRHAHVSTDASHQSPTTQTATGASSSSNLSASSRPAARSSMKGMLGRFRIDPFATRIHKQHVVYQPPVEFEFSRRESDSRGSLCPGAADAVGAQVVTPTVPALRGRDDRQIPHSGTRAWCPGTDEHSMSGFSPQGGVVETGGHPDSSTRTRTDQQLLNVPPLNQIRLRADCTVSNNPAANKQKRVLPNVI